MVVSTIEIIVNIVTHPLFTFKTHSHRARLRPSTDVDALGVNGPLLFQHFLLFMQKLLQCINFVSSL